MSITLKNGEKIIKHSLGPYIKSTLNVINGTFYLSNQRFVFAKPSFISSLLLGVFSQWVKASKILFELNLTDIVKIELLKKSYYNIYTKENCYKVGFIQDSKKWHEYIIQAIKENTVSEIEYSEDSIFIKRKS